MICDLTLQLIDSSTCCGIVLQLKGLLLLLLLLLLFQVHREFLLLQKLLLQR